MEKSIRRGRALLAVAILLAGGGPAQGEPAQLTVGQSWAWVREFFPPSGAGEIDRIVWTNPPAQIDLATLQVWNVRRPWPVREWRRLVSSPPPAPGEGNAGAIWRPRKPPPPPPELRGLEIHLARPLSHRMGHSLTYRLPDFSWTAFYRVVVRGLGPESAESVQVDLEGYLRIRNETSSAFPAALVSVVGTDAALQAPPKPFGRLDLNRDTALTDLWLAPPAAAPAIPASYPLRTEAAIPANGQAEIQFARLVRKPAQIVHVCDSGDIPAPTPQGGLPLRRILLVPNTPAMGLGFPLPPGDADLFLGAARGAPFQSGHAAHTSFPGSLRLDMGTVDAVRATRRAGKEEALPEGARHADYEVEVRNDLESTVRVRVLETPATSRPWRLVRSSLPCTQTTRTLEFDLTLPSKSSKKIEYRLRLGAHTES